MRKQETLIHSQRKKQAVNINNVSDVAISRQGFKATTINMFKSLKDNIITVNEQWRVSAEKWKP